MASKAIQILLIEDSPGDVELIRIGLRKGKITNELHVASDGAAGLAFLNKEPPFEDKPTPDLVLLDINLPKKNGHEVLKEVRANPKTTALPVIILTTSNQDRDILLSYTHHANAYVTKPVSAADFLAAIAGIEHFWLTLVKMPGGRSL